MQNELMPSGSGDITELTQMNAGSRLHISSEMYHGPLGPVPSLTWVGVRKPSAQVSVYGDAGLMARWPLRVIRLADDYSLASRDGQEYSGGIEDIVDLGRLGFINQGVGRQDSGDYVGSFCAGFFFCHFLLFPLKVLVSEHRVHVVIEPYTTFREELERKNKTCGRAQTQRQQGWPDATSGSATRE